MVSLAVDLAAVVVEPVVEPVAVVGLVAAAVAAGPFATVEGVQDSAPTAAAGGEASWQS